MCLFELRWQGWRSSPCKCSDNTDRRGMLTIGDQTNTSALSRNFAPKFRESHNLMLPTDFALPDWFHFARLVSLCRSDNLEASRSERTRAANAANEHRQIPRKEVTSYSSRTQSSSCPAPSPPLSRLLPSSCSTSKFVIKLL